MQEREKASSKNGKRFQLIGVLVFTILSPFAARAADDCSTQTLVGLGETTGAGSERRLIISLQDRKLVLIDEGRVVRTYSIAVGKRTTPSPIGCFKILNRIEGPTYYHAGVVVPPGKSNPLGSRWMGLSRLGYGIHGTNAPDSIGHAASHGCIRMRKHDVEELFELVRVGDSVEIVPNTRGGEWAQTQARAESKASVGDPQPPSGASEISPVVMAAVASETP